MKIERGRGGFDVACSIGRISNGHPAHFFDEQICEGGGHDDESSARIEHGEVNVGVEGDFCGAVGKAYGCELNVHGVDLVVPGLGNERGGDKVAFVFVTINPTEEDGACFGI